MNPPVFYKGKNLQAQDLVDMEEYLLAVNSMKDAGYGVIRLFCGDHQPRISRGKTGLACYFIIDEVIGITPSGRPVQFKAAASTQSLNLPVSFAHENDKVVADIFVDDLHFSAEKENDRELPGKAAVMPLQKYQLSMDLIAEETTPINYRKNNGNSLYLGRYVLWFNRMPEMIQPPLPYFLAAVRFPSSWWNEWTRDIRDALKKILDKHKENPAIVAFILNIAYNFHRWPVGRLMQACNMLDALVVSAALDVQNALEEEFWLSKLQSKDSLDLIERKMTNDIPALIISLLKEGAGTELVSKSYYQVQGGRLLTFSLKESDVKYLKIEIPASYTPQISNQGVAFTTIRFNEFEKKHPEIITEPDVFKGQRRYFECEYLNNGPNNCTILVDFEWSNELKIFKSQSPFKLTLS
ncbi:MAG: hypothetical protein P0Y53_19250 [Candidatus Pseudobacter hemicellulosilyticus]|uniref:Uncharacterized protein n=1 Tax=Candidatus Pseudobacter hemicellulosilyticus TaxID=3121375 RepID=A0AAJ5WNZ5_9BACT|nr:MAG: hypothetical protein P0Y53_19250 [Pseudobacter sp.]